MNPIQVLIKFATEGLPAMQQSFAAVGTVLARQREAVVAYNAAIANGSRALQAILSQAATLLGGQQLLQSVGAAREASVALGQLQRVLQSTGNASAETEARFTAQAAALEDLTGLADEAVMDAQRTLLTLGATADEAERLTPLVLDLAVALGTTAPVAAKQLRAALDGQGGELGKLNIQAKSFDGVVAELTAKVGGLAATTHAAKGPTAALVVEWGKFQEAVGGVLLPLVDAFVGRLVPALRQTREEIEQFAAAHPQLLSALTSLAGIVGQMAGQFGPQLAALLGTLLLVQGATTLLTPAVNLLRTGFFALGGPLQALTKEFGLVATLGANVSNVLATGTAPVAGLTAALELLGAAVLGAGVAIAGFQIGGAIAKLEVFGDTITNRITRVILGAQKVWAEFLEFFGLIDAAELTDRITNLNAAIADTNLAADRRDADQGKGGFGEDGKPREKFGPDPEAPEDRRRRLLEGLKAEQDLLARRRDTIAAGQILLDANFRRTEAEKRPQRLRYYEDEINQIGRLITKLEALRDAEQDPQLRGRYQDHIYSLQGQQRGVMVERQREQAQPDPDSVGQQFEARMTALRERMGTFAQDLSAVLVSPIEGFRDGLASSLDTLIEKGGTAGEFFGGIARGIGASMRKAFVDMVTDWIMSHVVMKGVAIAYDGFLKLLRWAGVIDANAAEAAKMPALAANATLASIGSWGIAVAVGLAAIAGILAATGAFAAGGETPGTPTLAWVGEKGPELVIPAHVNARLNPAQKSALVAGDFSEFGRRNAERGTAAGAQPAPESNRPLVIHNYVDKAAWLAAMRDDLEGIATAALRRAS